MDGRTALAGDAPSEARWRRTRELLLRLGNELGTAAPERIPQLVVDALAAATECAQGALFLRTDSGFVVRAQTGADPGSTLRAAAETALASGSAIEQATAEGIALAAPLAPAGALVVLQPSTSTIPTAETAERVGLFAAFAAAALGRDGALARQRNAALAAVHRLAARTAHELNNPLGGVKLYGRLIEQRLAKAGDGYGEGLAQKVGQAVDRLSKLITDFAERGRPAKATSDRVAINTVLRELLVHLEHRLTSTPIEAAADLANDVGEVTGDAQDLRRAFLHLLNNALDATPPEGRVTLTSRRLDPETVEVVIEDHGPGMDAATLTGALGLFFTTRPTAAGLGLATVRAAIEAHGGELDVDSEPGRGTRVSVRLPAAGR